MEDELELRLDAFQGPLALLLHLIEKNKIDIYDIPIFEITKQYLDYLKRWDDLNMEVASEFIVMAATLINIKARRLLPLAERDLIEEDDEAALTARLLEYKRYRDAGRELGTYLGCESDLVIWRAPETVQGERPIPAPEELLAKVTMAELKEIFRKAEASKRESYDTVRAGFKSVRKEKFTVAEKIANLKQRLILVEQLSFLELKKSCTTKEETVAYFMAMLEMTKYNQIGISQEDMFGDIRIERKDLDAEEGSESNVGGDQQTEENR